MRLGFGEIVTVLALAMLLFGPSRLPALGASLGEAIRGFKRGLSSMRAVCSPPPEAVVTEQLLEREDVLAELASALQGAAAGAGALVSGEAGMGRSALLSRFSAVHG